MPPLPQSFFDRPVAELARALLGCRIRLGSVILRITEVEAYAGPEDSASHARFGSTDRNAPMWGPPGHAYVYLCYGIHNMLNITAEAPGRAAAVLIRACEPIAGLEQIVRRRGGRAGPASLAGPGKVGAALELDTGWSGHPLYESGGLSVLAGERPVRVLAGPRVGIDFASPADQARPWRFAVADSPWVSQRRGLELLR
ncbi:MAG TPA: DNA-3-methyladenine glycosylase [Enhygromyxa sp.]|nr:DNA-3-methyladenine glycosylase [Enhygromyxa sp.]